MRVSTILVCIVFLVGCDDAAVDRDAPEGMVPGASSFLTEDIAKLQAAARGGDVDAVYAMMPGETAGARTDDNANVDLVLFYKSLRLKEPKPIVIAPDGSGSVIRFEAILHKGGKPMGRVSSSLVAVSSDDGASWLFVQIDRDAAKSYLKRELPKLYEAIEPTVPLYRMGEI